MRHALNFQLGLHARGPGRDSYKGVDEWKTPASVSLDRSLIRAAPSHKVLANFGGVFRSSSSTTDDADDFYGMSRPARRIDGFVSGDPSSTRSRRNWEEARCSATSTPVWKSTSVSGVTPSSRRRVDGVETHWRRRDDSARTRRKI